MCYNEIELCAQNLDPILGSIVSWEGRYDHRKWMSLWSLIAFASPAPSLGLELTYLCDLYVELAVVAIRSYALWLSLHHSATWHVFTHCPAASLVIPLNVTHMVILYLIWSTYMVEADSVGACSMIQNSMRCRAWFLYCVANMWVVDNNSGNKHKNLSFSWASTWMLGAFSTLMTTLVPEWSSQLI